MFHPRAMSRYGWLAVLLLVYFSFRLTNLTAVPIFNDEAIYLDWGWREIHVPGYLFYSLYDGKQPVLMWIFGLFQTLIPDQLLAGRLVSVLFGATSLLATYLIALNLSGIKPAVIAGFLYIFIPILHFFDRQALMESAVSATGLWALLLLYQLRLKRLYIYAVLLGMVLGLGFMVKSSTLVWAFATIIILLMDIIRNRAQPHTYIIYPVIIGLTALIVGIPVLVQPLFRQTLNMNSRYLLTAGELIQFPLSHWFTSFRNFSEIAFYHLSPPVFLIAVVTLIRGFFPGKPGLTLRYFMIALAASLFTVRNITERYTVPVLSLVPLVIATGGIRLSKPKLNGIIIPTILICVFITGMATFNPTAYFSLLGRWSDFKLAEYTTGVTSGYGLDQINRYLTEHIGSRRAYVGLALNSGNPESALIVYFHKHPNITVGYLDSRIQGNLEEYACVTAPFPVYFVSRNNELAGFGKFLIKRFEITNPLGGNRTGVYEINADCRGNSYKMDELYRYN